MAEKTRCEICDRNFKDEDGLAMHNNAKHSMGLNESNNLNKKEGISLQFKKIRNWCIALVIASLFVWGIIALIPNGGGLPPTDMDGHIESNPSSHVLKKPMRIEIQKHMLEHADGIEGGKGGVIVNYNCDDFICEENLIQNLEGFASQYNYVYVAPFKGMKSKIALTKLGKIQTFEEYDLELIKMFIEF